MSSQPPYGFRINPRDNSRIIKDLEEQDNIDRMVELRKEDRGLREICKILTEEGREPRGSRWQHPIIKRILHRSGVD